MYSAKISPPNTSWRCAGLVAAERVEVVADRLALVVGDADEHADDAGRHDRPQVGREVEVAGADQRIEQLRAHRPDLRLEPRHLAGREHPREQAAVDRVRGRILEDQRAGRELHAGLEQVERHAPTRDERLPVDVRALDVVEAAQRRRSRAPRCSRAALRRESGGTAHAGRTRSPRSTGRTADFRRVRLPSSRGIYRMWQSSATFSRAAGRPIRRRTRPRRGRAGRGLERVPLAEAGDRQEAPLRVRRECRGSPRRLYRPRGM